MNTLIPKKPMFMTAGNFPSKAANAIQVSKMADALTTHWPHLQTGILTGPLARLRLNREEIKYEYGLKNLLNFKSLPYLPFHYKKEFDQNFQAPSWWAKVSGEWAVKQDVDFMMTRKTQTAMICAKHGIASVLECHKPWEESPLIQKNMEMILSDSFRTLLVITQVLKKSFVNAGVPEEKILMLPTGVDTDSYEPSLQKQEARRKLGLKEDGFACAYVGHLYDDRGINEIISAAEQLRDIDFYMVGGWEKDINRYKKQTTSKNIQNMHFIGLVPQVEVPTYLFAADALLMPYNSHLKTANICSPLKLFEYLAAGRSIISTDLPALREILNHEGNALLINPDSSQDLIENIKKLQNNPQLCQQISQRSRSDSLQYSWTARAQKIIEHAYRDHS